VLIDIIAYVYVCEQNAGMSRGQHHAVATDCGGCLSGVFVPRVVVLGLTGGWLLGRSEGNAVAGGDMCKDSA
jgi:hypothetical protein